MTDCATCQHGTVIDTLNAYGDYQARCIAPDFIRRPFADFLIKRHYRDNLIMFRAVASATGYVPCAHWGAKT